MSVQRFTIEVSSASGEYIAHIKTEGGTILNSGIDPDPTRAILKAAQQLAGPLATATVDREDDEESCDGCGEPFGDYDGRYHKHCG
jgi:hypothetical protein